MSIRALARTIPLAALVLGAMTVGVRSASNDAIVTLDNRTGQTIELWVDRKFACQAPVDSTCTATVAPGEHELQGKLAGEIVAREFVSLQPGDTFSYKVEKSAVRKVCGTGPNTASMTGKPCT